jgi:hypothetical protein
MRAQCWISSSLCAALGVLGACASSSTGPSETERSQLPPGTAVNLLVTPSVAAIQAGNLLQLTANPTDARGPFVAPAEVVWASSNPNVARIGSDGTVVGAGPGTAQITARWHGMQGTSTVTVLGNVPPVQPCASLSVAAVGARARVPSGCRAP